tara:strand:+ start:25983 stop:30950 length:4968 start_codon:yes stop_codon:yes gene_type:complete
MTQIGFPSNPEDGMIFEIIPGLYYIYDASQNCWGRLDGFDSLSPATALADGLMPKEDLIKLNDLLIPPPQTSLQGEDCGSKFSSGKVALYSTDDSLKVTATPDVINTVNGQVVGGPQEWSLHRNTAGFDFRVNINQLLQEITARGILRKVQLQGDQGPTGEKGDPGEDRVDTGPVGSTGVTGANSPFDGSIASEVIPLESVDSNSNRAIVDLVAEVTDENEYKLVATRANIGNPDACPSLVVPKDFESQLILALNTIVGGKLVKNQVVQNSSGDCSLICRICSSSIHHLNIESIMDDLVLQFKRRIQRLKSDKEALVDVWVGGMIELFNQQKGALCCALENCKSRQRNERTKQYIETQRIAAAAADFKLQISSSNDSKNKINMDAFKKCPVEQAQPTAVTITDDGVIFRLEGKIHILDPRSGNDVQSLTAYLPAGSYVAEITDCCADFNHSAAGSQYSGRSGILYQALTSIGIEGEINFKQNITSSAAAFPDLGTFASISAARNAYQGITISFEHAGGDVSAWLLDPDGFVENNEGGATITITNVSALTSSSTPPSSGFVYAYRNEISTDSFVARVVPFVSGGTAADYLAVDGDGNVNPSGLTLVETTAQNFFHLGTDGLSFFFVGGAVPGTGNDEADFTANMQVALEVNDNALSTSIAAQSPGSTILQSSETAFEGGVNIASSSGFAIGELDGLNWSIVFDPLNLDTMRSWLVADPDQGEILLAQGGTEGLGPQTSQVRDVVSVALYDVTVGSSSEDESRYGGGNEFAIESENNVAGQNYTVTRPINIEVPAAVPGSTPEETIIPAPIPEGLTPPDGDDPRDVPDGDDPKDVPEDDGDDPEDVPTTVKGGLIVIPGVPIVSEEASMLPRGTPGSPQDPCILDISISIQSSSSVSLRYILTDISGNKYYSAFHTVGPESVGVLSSLSLGMPVQVLSPPDIFTETVIAQKTIEESAIKSSLTANQLRRAIRLEGIARLTYVQGLLGTPVEKAASGRVMTDIEIEYQNAPIGTVAIGVITATIGIPGSSIEVIIDDFNLPQTGLAQGENFVLGRIKRVVGTKVGTDSLNTGLLYSSLGSYYGDYEGFDTVLKRGINFNGNNHFLFNEAGNQRVTHLNVSSGFNDLVNNDNRVLNTVSGSVSGDCMAVDDHGVVYIVDGPAGTIISFLASNSLIRNTSFGDANGLAANTVITMEEGLPTSNNVSIALGDHVQAGPNLNQELYIGIGSNWYLAKGMSKTYFSNGSAFRDDVTTPRCCFGVGNPPGSGRTVAVAGRLRNSESIQLFGTGFSGVAVTSSKPANPQPTLPVPSEQINQFHVEAIQEELDLEFNQYSVFSIEDNAIYTVVSSNGARVLFRDIPENGFGLKINPVTKDIYYITNDRGSTPIPSGTRIKRIDVDDIDPDTSLPRIKTVYRAEGDEGIFAINFGNTLPPKSDLGVEALYVVLSTLQIGGAGQTVNARVVEVTESPVPPVPGAEPDNKVPTNSTWTASGNGKSVGGVGQNPNRVIFSPIPPGSGCQMHYKQVEWYERGWRIGACCGALIEVGTDNWWVIVKRSIGIDTTCGGGESESTPCVRQFIDSGDGHPAIAWPTTTPPFVGAVGNIPGGGGEEFLGLPTSGFVNFMKDQAMSDAFLGIINGGSASKIIGNPGSEIPFILFPSL